MDVFKNFVDNYLPKANPTYSLVYLYALRFALDMIDIPTDEHIAETLRIMDSDVANAWKHWQKKGLVKITEKGPHVFLDKFTPKLSQKEIAKKISEDSRLAWLYGEVLALYDGDMSSSDTRTLYWIYINLKLPKEVLLVLVQYCRNNKKGMRYIEKMAMDWHEKGIDTIDKADAAIKQIGTGKSAKTEKKTKFSNFEQRSTNYDDLEDAYFDEILKGMNGDG